MAGIMLGAPALASPHVFPTEPLTDPTAIAAAFDAKIVRNTDGCGTPTKSYIEVVGCASSTAHDTIYVSPDLEGEKLRYVVLHELGHVMQFRLGIERDECQADVFASSLGGGDKGINCKP